jgi:hypothetical protein
MKRLDGTLARVHHYSMGEESTAGAAEFEPPKYLGSLIEAINDGAKAAQGSALAFLLVGIYLLATAFSSSDEDLLLGKTVTISQIGASLPVGFSFALAPLVFVFVHLYTLARYDMLAANVRYFVGKLRQDVPTETDREYCRQLLANVEFLAALTAPRGSGLYSRFWPWLFSGIIVVFPVAVLLLVQVNALRYQSDLIIWVQRAALALDLAALTWFFRRNSLDGSEWPDRRSASVRRWARLLWLPAVVLALNFLYLNIVPADADAKLVHYTPLESHLELNPIDSGHFAIAFAGRVRGCGSLRFSLREKPSRHTAVPPAQLGLSLSPRRSPHAGRSRVGEQGDDRSARSRRGFGKGARGNRRFGAALPLPSLRCARREPTLCGRPCRGGSQRREFGTNEPDGCEPDGCEPVGHGPARRGVAKREAERREVAGREPKRRQIRERELTKGELAKREAERREVAARGLKWRRGLK